MSEVLLYAFALYGIIRLALDVVYGSEHDQ